MNKALEIVEKLNDVQAVMMLKQIYQDIFTAIPLEDIKQNIEYQESVSMLKDLDLDIMKQNIAFIGFGVVGQGLAEILVQDKEELQKKFGYEF